MTNTAITRDGSGALQWAGRVLSPYIAQSPEDGARSTIQADHDDAAQRHVPVPPRPDAPVGQAEANDSKGQGNRSGKRAAAMGAVRRADRVQWQEGGRQ